MILLSLSLLPVAISVYWS